MSQEFIATPLDTDTDVSLHAGNPDLLNLDEARALRAARELSLAAEVLAVTPQIYLGRVGDIVSAARRHELDSTISLNEAA